MKWYNKQKRYIIQEVQHSEFLQEIIDLKRGGTVAKSSKLFKLNVYLDDREILRRNGRAKRLNNHEDEIVLPARHHVTFLIIRSFHEDYHHHCHEAVIKIKGQYYFHRSRVVYKKVRNSYQKCKNSSAAPNPFKWRNYRLLAWELFNAHLLSLGLIFLVHYQLQLEKEKKSVGE